MLRRNLERYGGALLSIVLLVVVSVVAGAYILVHERLRTPFQHTYRIQADFTSANGIVPGQGAPVNVAGVKVGSIAGIQLVEGHARVALDVDPGKLPRVFADARALLVPNTPLKDMQIELSPGGPPAAVLRPSDALPIDQTVPPIDADELLASLDADTRLWLQSAVAGLDQGTRGRTGDLRSILQQLGPTTSELRRVGDALASRRAQLSHLVHNLGILARAAGSRDRQLAGVVSAGNVTVQALASEDAALAQSVGQLPGTLVTARRTLADVGPFADALGPTLNALEPAAQRLPGALRAADPLLRETEPVLRMQLRPFLREVLPLVSNLRPASQDLAAATPALIGAFGTLAYATNELAYNAPGNDEGYLFWLAWFAHNANSALSTGDANGAVFRGLAVVSCSSLTGTVGLSPLLQALVGGLPGCAVGAKPNRAPRPAPGPLLARPPGRPLGRAVGARVALPKAGRR